MRLPTNDRRLERTQSGGDGEGEHNKHGKEETEWIHAPNPDMSL